MCKNTYVAARLFRFTATQYAPTITSGRICYALSTLKYVMHFTLRGQFGVL